MRLEMWTNRLLGIAFVLFALWMMWEMTHIPNL